MSSIQLVLLHVVHVMGMRESSDLSPSLQNDRVLQVPLATSSTIIQGNLLNLTSSQKSKSDGFSMIFQHQASITQNEMDHNQSFQ